jgi:hypothetical protein
MFCWFSVARPGDQLEVRVLSKIDLQAAPDGKQPRLEELGEPDGDMKDSNEEICRQIEDSLQPRDRV